MRDTFSTTVGGIQRESALSYVQVNIYDTNMTKLREEGIDLVHILRHVGHQSVIMDIPICTSVGATLSPFPAISRGVSIISVDGRKQINYSNEQTSDACNNKLESGREAALDLSSMRVCSSELEVPPISATTPLTSTPIPRKIDKSLTSSIDGIRTDLNEATIPISDISFSSGCVFANYLFPTGDEDSDSSKDVRDLFEDCLEDSHSANFMPAMKLTEETGTPTVFRELGQAHTDSEPQSSDKMKKQRIIDGADPHSSKEKQESMSVSNYEFATGRSNSRLSILSAAAEEAFASEDVSAKSYVSSRGNANDCIPSCCDGTEQVYKEEDFLFMKIHPENARNLTSTSNERVSKQNVMDGKGKREKRPRAMKADCKYFTCQFQNCAQTVVLKPQYGKCRLVEHARLHWNKSLKVCKHCDHRDVTYGRENIGCRSIIMDVPILVPRVEGCTAGKCHNDSQEELPGHQPTPNALDLTYHLIYGKAKSSSVRAMTLKSKGFSATKETMNRSSCSERRCDDTLPVTRLQSAGADECSQAVERHTFVSVADPLDQTMRAAECSSSWPPSEASEEAAQDEKPVTVFSEADYSALRWQSVEESGSLFFDPGNVNDSDSRGSQSMSDALAKLKIPAAPEVSVDKYQSITDVPDSPLNEPKGFTRLKTVCQSDILNVLAQRSSSLCVEQLPSEPLEQKADAEENIEKRSPSPKRQRCQEPAEHCDPVVEREEFDVGKGCFKSLKWYPKMGRSRLVEHARAHWKKKVKKCKICGYTATDVRTVHRHHTLKHGTEPFMGAISNETKEDWDELEQCYKKCFPGESPLY
ncbi:unnamed protein product [Nippostrongylus brasiliensis]|uniref:C2H2-type domain-containing protein n=1 Tax=Nippostrongylus brasiliensis TaxID=27835 RepID=A0A158QWI4_NIPBR|nr:unnamed protein product [Nippostrongylus brasiliensis]